MASKNKYLWIDKTSPDWNNNEAHDTACYPEKMNKDYQRVSLCWQQINLYT